VSLARDASLVSRSVETILANQEANGAIIASPDFAQYHFCWLRDGSFCAYALDLAGEHGASARYHAWVAHAVDGIADVMDQAVDAQGCGEPLSPADMPPARFALDGSTVIDDWPNFQIDGYGTWLWSLGEHLDLSGSLGVPDHLLDSARRVAAYLSAFALTPCFDVWEENGDAVHTSTLASVYGGLIAAARLLGDDGYRERAEAVRVRARESVEHVGHFVKSSASDDVDASALWLSIPFAVVASDDEHFAKTVALIEDRLEFEGGIRRYPTDVYFGSGAWPVLTASLGLHRASIGDVEGAARCLDWITARIDAGGRLGEQYGGERRDGPHFREWVERWGPPARDLTWSHAMFVALAAALDGSSHQMNRRN
jgi:GH15 family glucan-1,4-alpha-glucosidase